LDSSAEFLKKSRDLYAQAGIKSYGVVLAEKQQPLAVVKYIKYFKPDVLVVTGHDSLKKGKPRHDIDSYSNSRYYARSVAEVRRVVPQKKRLAIVAGACQSYYELLMSSGADFASSPGRIVINSVDPAIAAAIIAGVPNNEAVAPDVVAQATVSGPDGLWGKELNGMAECGII
jgi:spore coat assembly protein